MILNIGEWVVREACRQAKAWQASGLKGVSVAVNVSASQLSRQNLHELVAGALAESGLEPEFLELELTESCAMSDVHQSIEVLDRLKELGTRCAIDDFGTGYSSFSYLKRLPVDCLKIDRSFVSDISDNADDRAIVSGIISMAHSLGLTVVAEGVEDRTQLEFLRNQECDLVQGYLFSKPLPPDEFLQWLVNEKNGNEVAVK